MTQENDLLTRDEVLTLLKVSRSKLYELMRQDFPKPIKFGSSNRWLRMEVEEWINARIQARDEQPTTVA